MTRFINQAVSKSYLVGLLSDVYAAIVHNHDGVYSPVSHNHDGVYATVGHNHDGTYAPITHSHNASDINAGIIDPARLGTGTANAGTVLHGDSVFRAASGGSFASLTGAPTDNAALTSALNARLALTGGTMTGAILAPNGTTAATAYGFSAAANSGMIRTTDGVVIVHNGTGSLDVRSSGIFVTVNVSPTTDNTRTLGSFSLRWARVTATQYRATLGSGNGYIFDDGAGNPVNSGVYAVSTTTVGMNLNGTSAFTITSSGMNLQTGTLQLPTYTVGTLPSASANTGRMLSVNNTPARSDGTNWRYLTDNSIVV